MAPRKLVSLVDQIYDHLRIAIITGELKPGQRIVELEVAAEMGTSLAPVREALHRLETDGLVDRQPRIGTFVTDATIDEIQELFQIRALVEQFAVRRTAATIDAEQLDLLQSLVDQMHQAAKAGNMLRLATLDLQFHRLICEWSGNAHLVRAWMPLYSQMQRFVTQTHPSRFADIEEVASLHEPIVAALRRHDSEAAADLIEQHILLSFRQLESSKKR
ncbi:MAG: GntR family transcriptional regulator [Anaerolineae bacterium]